MTTTAATAMSAAMRPYSIAVTPSSVRPGGTRSVSYAFNSFPIKVWWTEIGRRSLLNL
jgi:hypothetical protein